MNETYYTLPAVYMNLEGIITFLFYEVIYFSLKVKL